MIATTLRPGNWPAAQHRMRFADGLIVESDEPIYIVDHRGVGCIAPPPHIAAAKEVRECPMRERLYRVVL
jgi:hypothetical protein